MKSEQYRNKKPRDSKWIKRRQETHIRKVNQRIKENYLPEVKHIRKETQYRELNQNYKETKIRQVNHIR